MDASSRVESIVGRDASLETSFDAGSRNNSRSFGSVSTLFFPTGVEVDMLFVRAKRAEGGILGVVCKSLELDGGALKSDPSGVFTTAFVLEFLTTAFSAVLPPLLTGVVVDAPAVGSKSRVILEAGLD